MAFFGLALYMLPGLFGAQLGALDAYLPPRQASDPNLVATTPAGPGQTSANEELDWHVDDRTAAFEAARTQDKPVFIDFTGYTCTNCRDMEANVFTQPEIARRFEDNFVLLRLYTDAQPKGPEYQRYQLRLTGTTALPTYVVLDPQTETPIDRVSGTMSAEVFGRFLDQGAAAFRDQQLAAR
jgi:thiol:disulfide interchange protein DsbD